MSDSRRQWLMQLLNLEGLVYLALLPLVMFATPTRALVLLLVPLFWLVRKMATGRWTLTTPLDWPVRLLVAMVLVSLWVSFDFAFSFPRVVAVLYGLALIYALAWFSSRSTRHLGGAVLLFVLMGLGIATLSLLGTSWSTKFGPLAPIVNRLPHLISLPGADDGFQANQVAGVLLWVTPVAAALAYTAIVGRKTVTGDFLQRHTIRLALLGATGVMGLVLLLAQSRGGWIGFAAAIMLLLMLALHRRPWLAWALPLVATLLIALTINIVGVERMESLLFDFRSESSEAALESLSIRQEVWVRGWYAVQDFPLTGMGMNTFRRVVPVLYPFLALSGVEDIAHAHNQFLQAALDVGIPGLIGYVGMWLAAAAMLWQSWRQSEDVWVKTLVAGFAAALLSYFIYGLTDAVAFGAKPGFLFWYLFGLIAGLHEWVVNRQYLAIDPSVSSGQAD